MPSGVELMTLVLCQLMIVLIVCRLVGMVLRPLLQSQVVADMVAGFLLGPSLFGLLLPQLQSRLFPATVTVGSVDVVHPAASAVYVLGQVGLILYMFLVGLSFDAGLLRSHFRHSAFVSIFGILVPIVLGGALGWHLAGSEGFFTGAIEPWQGALYVGAAVAITAFPMLARIIHDSGLSRTRLGTMALACAAVDDAAAWILLAFVVSVTSDDPLTAVLASGGVLVYVLFMTTIGRRLLARLTRRAEKEPQIRTHWLTAFVLVLFACAVFTEATGVHAVFGAFVLGAVMPRGPLSGWLRERIQPLTVAVLLPMFFVYAGLQTRIDFLLDPAVLGVALLTLLVAFAGKGGACFVAYRLAGGGKREAASLAALMNARGLMELILLDIGLSAGLITPVLFTVLALMTVVTTLATTPLFTWVQSRRRHQDSGSAGEREDSPVHA